ncbi:hypothetical protein RV18_GL002345 [Enterococcus termitis]|nr:hypothetical protein RV18_GL002345 [Enterococcus termitis]
MIFYYAIMFSERGVKMLTEERHDGLSIEMRNFFYKIF